MPSKSYDHIKVDIPAFKLPFSGTGGGDLPPRIPTVPDRRGHARRLTANLREIVESKVAFHDPELPEEASGIHVTATARTRAGVQASGNLMEILSIKGEGKNQRVNLFIRTDRIEKAVARIQRYGEFEEDSRKPDNFALFESADRFAGTRLEDLWTDLLEAFPTDMGKEARWELWVRSEAADRVRNFAGRYGLRCEPGQADFPSVSVIRVRARPGNLAAFVDATSAVLELRACSSLTLQKIDLAPTQQRALAKDLLLRHISAPPADAPRICILDSGVLAHHPLLAPAISAQDCHTLNDAWERYGWNSHGTKVAGIALYPNLEELIARPRTLKLTTRLESVVVLRPEGKPRSPQESIGEIAAAVNVVESAEQSRRVFCLASADYRGLNDGVPTKLSGSVDQLAWGYNGRPRLFCVAAGNVLDDPFLVTNYASRNEASGIGSPGQALNALTVGGCTFRDEHPHDGTLLCPAGDLSVSSRTSTSWIKRRSTKPDVVFEAGNIGVPADRNATACESLPELNVLTTHNSRQFPLGTFGETSAATGAVAGMAARLMARYPDYWPETIRGLIVHSASWTDAMVARGQGSTKEETTDHILSLFGWGVPNEEESANSASDYLTLVFEGALTPYKKDGTSDPLKLNECAYHLLPWPIAALEALGRTGVQLRVTLSYFVQPDMRAPSTRKHTDYPSHRLSFDLKGPDDDDLDTVRRRNMALKEARKSLSPARTEANWALGSMLRDRGAIHHDVWTGAADELLRQNAIRVSPRGGWWRSSSDYAGVSVRYSLIVSIKTPESRQDIYQEALSRIPILRRAPVPAVLKPHIVQPIVVRS